MKSISFHSSRVEKKMHTTKNGAQQANIERLLFIGVRVSIYETSVQKFWSGPVKNE